MAQEAKAEDKDKAVDYSELKKIIGEKFLNRDLKETTFKERIEGNEVILIYFSAHWYVIFINEMKITSNQNHK